LRMTIRTRAPDTSAAAGAQKIQAAGSVQGAPGVD
jgi:hypothetical protein